jgi:hypothetical protein
MHNVLNPVRSVMSAFPDQKEYSSILTIKIPDTNKKILP